MAVHSKKKLNSIELSYIAGFFDGEGSITINTNGKPSPRSLSPNHTLYVSIGNTNESIVKWIYSIYGGGLSFRKKNNPRWRPVWQWSLRCSGAADFLRDVLPYLKMKNKQAVVAIHYQERKKMRGPKRVSLEEIQWREEQRTQLRILNGRYWEGLTRHQQDGSRQQEGDTK